MLARSIYEETKRDIQDHSNVFTKQLRDAVLAEQSIFKALISANRISNLYHAQLTQTVFNRLRAVGHNAVENYAPELNALQREQEVGFAMDELVHNKYYGLTLPQRLKQSHLQLRRNIKRSSSVGAKLETKLLNLTRVFNNTYPFGAQKHWDTRLFLAEAVRLEHVLAKNLAIRKAYKLIRWTLSDTHSQQDVCDKVANRVDRDVQDYLDKQKFDLDPSGVYFISHVPPIPHPNCQCTLQYVYTTPQGKRRQPKERLNLIQRILKAIFG